MALIIIINGEKGKNLWLAPWSKFWKKIHSFLDISISYPNIQKYSKKLKN